MKIRVKESFMGAYEAKKDEIIDIPDFAALSLINYGLAETIIEVKEVKDDGISNNTRRGKKSSKDRL